MHKSRNIYITDDDEGVQDIFKIIFERAGYQVSVFADGESLLKHINDPPDIFILDKQLSGMDGLDICRFLKSNPETKDIPLIMVSATPNIANAVKEAGANELIEKPFKVKDILQRVDNYFS